MAASSRLRTVPAARVFAGGARQNVLSLAEDGPLWMKVGSK
jgi:hypothetical protein